MNIYFEMPDRRLKKVRKSAPGWVLPAALGVLLYGRIAWDVVANM